MAPEFWYDVDRNGRRRRIKIDAQNHDEARDEFIDRYGYDPKKKAGSCSGYGVNDNRGQEQIEKEQNYWSNFYNSQSDNEGFKPDLDLGTSFTLCLVLGGIILFFYALPFIIVFGAIGLIGWGCYKFIKWILK